MSTPVATIDFGLSGWYHTTHPLLKNIKGEKVSVTLIFAKKLPYLQYVCCKLLGCKNSAKRRSMWMEVLPQLFVSNHLLIEPSRDIFWTRFTYSYEYSYNSWLIALS